MQTRYYILLAFLFLFGGCAKDDKGNDSILRSQLTTLQEVDSLDARVQASIVDFEIIARLDHHRMAAEDSVYTPPAVATIFSSPEINTEILAKSDPLVALDLPFKLLVFADNDTSTVQIAATSGSFIARRHALDENLLASYDDSLDKVLIPYNSNRAVRFPLDSVSEGYGIVRIPSAFDFTTTVNNLKRIVDAQTDTRWFGEVDYSSDAQRFGVQLRPAKMLLFGAPGPGARCMVTTPRIGLDAFCQKLLVYQNEDSKVYVAFNDIEAMSNLYYGTSTKPQSLINQRLISTFTKVISEPTQ